MPSEAELQAPTLVNYPNAENRRCAMAKFKCDRRNHHLWGNLHHILLFAKGRTSIRASRRVCVFVEFALRNV